VPPGSVMISKLRVQNFKCLRDVTVELKPLTVLIGKNDTGKTSLLEAVETLAVLADDRPPQRSIEEVVWVGAEPPFIEWTADLIPTPRNKLPAPATYSVHISPRDRREDGWKRTEAFLLSGVEIDETKVATMQLVRTALAGAGMYRFAPALLRQPSAFNDRSGSVSPVPRLELDGLGLARVLDYLLGAKRKIFDTIERELHEAVPLIESIQLKPWSNKGAPSIVGKSLSFEIAGSRQEIPANCASDGVLLFLAYLTLVHAPDPPSTLLIEELENGIHPRQLQRVAEYLKRLSDPARGASAVQIITATHSPYLLDFVPPDAVLVFGRRPNGETVVAPLLSLPGVQERLDSGFSLGEMWFNVGEDRLLAEVLR
jgi:predicted ATPase